MDRATKAVRRSATRLISPNESATELSLAVQELKEMKGHFRKLVACQQAASESILKWSLHEENRAIRDVAFQLNELAGISAFVQEQFCRNISESAKQLEYLAESNKQLLQANKEASSVAAKESKIKREISSPSQWKKGGDIRLLETQLAQTTQMRELTERKLEESHAEFEAVKMMRFKSAMVKLAEAQLELSAATNVVFEAHRDVSQQIPDVSTENVRQMQYCGSSYTRERVGSVRDRMMQGRQNFVRNDVRRATVASVGRSNAKFYDPPPPYNPNDPNAQPAGH